jgi:hypothetical protein
MKIKRNTENYIFFIEKIKIAILPLETHAIVIVAVRRVSSIVNMRFSI